MAYNLFGNGKTAVKVTLNKYVQGQLTGVATTANPVGILITNTTRAWGDANHDFVANCERTNPALNGECAAMSNSNFGKVIQGSTFFSAREN